MLLIKSFSNKQRLCKIFGSFLQYIRIPINQVHEFPEVKLNYCNVLPICSLIFAWDNITKIYSRLFVYCAYNFRSLYNIMFCLDVIVSVWILSLRKQPTWHVIYSFMPKPCLDCACTNSVLYVVLSFMDDSCAQFKDIYGLGHEGGAVLLPGFAIKW